MWHPFPLQIRHKSYITGVTARGSDTISGARRDRARTTRARRPRDLSALTLWGCGMTRDTTHTHTHILPRRRFTGRHRSRHGGRHPSHPLRRRMRVEIRTPAAGPTTDHRRTTRVGGGGGAAAPSRDCPSVELEVDALELELELVGRPAARDARDAPQANPLGLDESVVRGALLRVLEPRDEALPCGSSNAQRVRGRACSLA